MKEIRFALENGCAELGAGIKVGNFGFSGRVVTYLVRWTFARVKDMGFVCSRRIAGGKWSANPNFLRLEDNGPL